MRWGAWALCSTPASPIADAVLLCVRTGSAGLGLLPHSFLEVELGPDELQGIGGGGDGSAFLLVSERSSG